MAKKTKKPKYICPFYDSWGRCVHRPDGNSKHSGKIDCSYIKNHKKCDIWRNSHTEIKEGLELLKMREKEKDEPGK